MFTRRILLPGLAALALVAPLAASPTHGAGGRSTAASPPPFTLTMPSTVTAESDDGYAYLEDGPRLVAGAAPFELRTTRASYEDPVTVRWLKPGGAVTLPAGTTKNFYGLPKFFKLAVRGPKGHLFGTQYLPLCPGEVTQRARPDAPAHSPYPSGCPYNPFTLGSVVGIQAGWYAEFGDYEFGTLRLKPGRYTLNTSVTPAYRRMFGVTTAQGFTRSRLVVTKVSDDERARRARAARASGAVPPAKPASKEPADAGAAPDAGPRPDLRSLPAFGMQISPRGNYLQFSATVWNGGTGPMVVDGFRRKGQDLMDAYQYFFDTSGNQTGYQKVGTMEWDPRPSHHHWHFEDFARYRLLTADKKLARRSQKEAFCLANTDAVDYTLPAADWHPDGTDLGTACGDYGSLSVRESLATGSGDTYTQERAGQSFNLKGLPNGIYYVSVEANPTHNLVETSTTNDNSLRKIRIGGRTGHRTVTSWKVGLVDDTDFGWGFFRAR